MTNTKVCTRALEPRLSQLLPVLYMYDAWELLRGLWCPRIKYISEVKPNATVSLRIQPIPINLAHHISLIFYKNYENWQILDCINIYSLVNLDELLIINIVHAWKDLCIVIDGERLGLKQERTYFLVTFPCFFFPDLRYFFHDFFTFRIFV